MGSRCTISGILVAVTAASNCSSHICHLSCGTVLIYKCCLHILLEGPCKQLGTPQLTEPTPFHPVDDPCLTTITIASTALFFLFLPSLLLFLVPFFLLILPIFIILFLFFPLFNLLFSWVCSFGQKILLLFS